ncbi:MAG: hypothetical protein HY606_14315 [Planctomycetes bacterium]|nr:hypothetical protein [Planctomycetota bacterium]
MNVILLIITFQSLSLQNSGFKDEEEFSLLISSLDNKDVIKRSEAGKRLINMWQNDKFEAFIRQELSKENGIYSNDTLIRLKDVYDKIQFRRDLGKDLVEAFGNKVDLVRSWDLKRLINFIRSSRDLIVSGLDDTLRFKYAEWISRKLQSKDDKEIFLDTISGRTGLVQVEYHPLRNSEHLIAKFLEDRDHHIRGHAIGTLIAIKSAIYTDRIIEFLQDQHIEIRSGVLESIGLLSLQQYAKEAANHLKDPSNYVKYTAMETLIKLNAKEFAEDITKFISLDFNLDNSDCKLVCSDSEYLETLSANNNKILFVLKAIEFVQKVGAKEYIPKIEELLSSQEIELSAKVEILEALLELDYKEKYIDEAADLIKQGTTFAVRVLGKYRAKRYGDLISSCLNDKESSIRNLAIEALVQLRDKQYAPDLAKLLLDKECAEPAAEALKTLGVISESNQYLALIRKQYLHSEDVFMKLTGLAVADILDLKELAPDIEKLVDDMSGYQNIYCSLDNPCVVENISVGKNAKKLLEKWNVDIKQLQKENKTK